MQIHRWRARSFLFLPGTRMDRFDKAHASGAGGVIVDLEDAVPPDHKPAARDAIGQALAACTADVQARTLVRVNAADTPWGADDLRVAAGWEARGLGGIVLPKAEPGNARVVAAALSGRAALLPLIESLAGLDGVETVASMPGVVRLAFGHLDFSSTSACTAVRRRAGPGRRTPARCAARSRLTAPA